MVALHSAKMAFFRGANGNASTRRAPTVAQDHRSRRLLTGHLAMDVDTSRKTIGHRALPPGLDTGLFFVLFYLYVWLAIDPRLVYHSLTILTPYYPFSFQTGWPFFWKQVAHSGGTVEYVARGLSALWAFGWAGALILTAAAWCATVFTDALNARVGLPRGKVLRYVPAVIVLEMYGSYAHPLSILLSLLISLGCFVLYVRVVPPSPLWRLPTLLIGCPVLFLIAGAGSLLFGVMVAIDEVLVGGRRLVAVAASAGPGFCPGPWRHYSQSTSRRVTGDSSFGLWASVREYGRSRWNCICSFPPCSPRRLW